MPTSDKPTAYRLTFNPHLTKVDRVKEAIDALLHHIGCAACGRLSAIDFHIAERDVKLNKEIEGLLHVTEISK